MGIYYVIETTIQVNGENMDCSVSDTETTDYHL